MRLRNVCALSNFVAALAATWAGAAMSQDYPTRPVRIVTSPAGGGSDQAARLVAQGLSPLLGQQVIVDNRPAILAPVVVAKSPPDGYTVLVAGSTLWLGPLIEKVQYDPLKDFAPVTVISRAAVVLVVHPSMPLKTVRQLIDLAKARPGDLNSAVGTPGSSNYLGAVLFDYLAGTKITRIPSKGAAPAVTALMSGEVQVAFPTLGACGASRAVGTLARARGRQREAVRTRAGAADDRSLRRVGLQLRFPLCRVCARRDTPRDRVAAEP